MVGILLSSISKLPKSFLTSYTTCTYIHMQSNLVFRPFLPGQAICTYLTTLVCFVNLLQRGMKTGLHLAVRNTASDKINKGRGNTQSYTNVM